jgi:hypothetical protein
MISAIVIMILIHMIIPMTINIIIIDQNNRGVYMRISEVKTNFRTAITIPEKSWGQ